MIVRDKATCGPVVETKETPLKPRLPFHNDFGLKFCDLENKLIQGVVNRLGKRQLL